MNLLHMKYAVEVARLGSLGKASETLLIATPNISRSIKELEADLGISIFERTTKGMELTPDGEQFINFAKRILGQIEQVELKRFAQVIVNYVTISFSDSSVSDIVSYQIYCRHSALGSEHPVTECRRASALKI